jgi:hypothetical protein
MMWLALAFCPATNLSRRYDGALGIIVGISAIKALVIRAALESGAELGAVAGPGQGEASWAVPDEMVRSVSNVEMQLLCGTHSFSVRAPWAYVRDELPATCNV